MKPFFAMTYDGRDFFHTSAEDRIRAVATFNKTTCIAALKQFDLQKTVRNAIERRLKQLNKTEANA